MRSTWPSALGIGKHPNASLQCRLLFQAGGLLTRSAVPHPLHRALRLKCPRAGLFFQRFLHAAMGITGRSPFHGLKAEVRHSRQPAGAVARRSAAVSAGERASNLVGMAGIGVLGFQSQQKCDRPIIPIQLGAKHRTKLDTRGTLRLQSAMERVWQAAARLRHIGKCRDCMPPTTARRAQLRQTRLSGFCRCIFFSRGACPLARRFVE